MLKLIIMKTLDLIIEKAEDGLLWGRVNYNGNVIIETANNISDLETKMLHLLVDFEGINPHEIKFTHLYDVYALFQKFDYLKISSVATYAGMNPGLLRQYASGVKNPSADQAKKIERTLHKLASDLQKVHIYTE